MLTFNSPTSSSSSNESSSSDHDSPSNKKSNRFSAETVKGPKRKAFHERDPIVEPHTLSDKEIKRRTGFCSEHDMLVYICIICNGQIEMMVRTSTALSWFEEWFFFFELKYGRSCGRWEDAASCEKYGICVKYLRKLFVRKLQLELTCRKSWPKYFSHAEDVFFMSDEFEERYKNRRIIMWDNTNINIAQPSCADMQRATWSSYYAHNVLKGGIFLMLCGWMGAHNLWTGAVSDTRYNGEGEILNEQKEFAESDLVNNQVLPFTNMTDKGYRLLLAAWQKGHQLVLQPDFKDSDSKFSAEQKISSSVIAKDRSANERAVKIGKTADFLHMAESGNVDLTLIDDVWLGWTFQANFMFKTVC